MHQKRIGGRIANEILMYFRSLKKTAGEVSLSDAIETDKDGSSIAIIDTIATADTMLDDISREEMCSQVVKYIDSVLTDMERKIIYMRYGLEETKSITQREIAEKCGISRSYVSRIEKKALIKLRRCFENE